MFLCSLANALGINEHQSRLNMRHYWLVVVLGAAPAIANAQAARIGRLPVLQLPNAGGTCRLDAANAELRRSGIAQMLSFTTSDSNSHRLVSLGVSVSGAPVILTAMMGAKEDRRGETESVEAWFDRTGRVWHGRRNAFTTGTPARLADDRHIGLLAADTLAAQRLAAALVKRCRA
jgi:hypothetical protein